MRVVGGRPVVLDMSEWVVHDLTLVKIEVLNRR